MPQPESRPRTILHVDMDAFYAAVEVREDPSLRGKPVIIGSAPRKGRGRGVVSTANYEARRYGIHSAMPISQAWRRCPDGVYVRPRIAFYAQISGRIFDIFRSFTDQVETLSLDEAFLDVTASRRLFGTGPEIATRIRRRIAEEERLTASVGVAPNKYVAKVASDLKKPDALVVVPPGTEREFLAPLSVSRLWGAGPKVQARLARLGFRRIGDVARNKPEFLEASLGRKLGRRLHELANGLDVRRVDPRPGRKSLGKEVTFPQDVEDRARVERTLLALCEGVGRSLRRKGIAGRTVQLKLRWDGFETHTRQRTLERPADVTEAIWPVARELFREADDPRRLVRLIGVSLSGFDHPEGEQLGLLGDDDPATSGGESRRELAKTMDAVADRFGHDALKRAALLDSNVRGM
ncbi:MAG: DNA polymerase IV [Gemmatimonadales bacterium]|nr:DNA polymerase IV [Gemmatimonadales bacterium]MYG48694.1 DNA polymerase IV [Gemmatimonadales bacterium]MYK02848.1 DNA polymerase IV [Candidatus Palauibacter ramosifaciens]